MKGNRLDGYYSVSETAEILGCARQYVQQLIADDKVKPLFYIGTTYLIPEATITTLKTMVKQGKKISKK